MNCPEIITDTSKFWSLQNEVEKIIDTRKRLPEFVFRHSFARYYAVYYANAYYKFATLLGAMSEVFGDESVNYMVLDPPADVYYSRASFFGLISFSRSALLRRYVEVMGVRGCSKILAGANLGLFWGSSLEWGVFADRISWELAVVATQKDMDVSTLLGWPCFNAESIREYMTSQYHAKGPSDSIASEFSDRFLSRYSL
jgi:hypothetical protein